MVRHERILEIHSGRFRNVSPTFNTLTGIPASIFNWKSPTLHQIPRKFEISSRIAILDTANWIPCKFSRNSGYQEARAVIYYVLNAFSYD